MAERRCVDQAPISTGVRLDVADYLARLDTVTLETLLKGLSGFALNKSARDTTNQGNVAVQPDALMMEDEESEAITQKKQKWAREIPLDHIEANPFQARQIFDQTKLE